MILTFNSKEHSFVCLTIGVLSNAHISSKVPCYHIPDGQRADSFSGAHLSGGVNCVPGSCQDDLVVSEPLECGGRVASTPTGHGGRLVHCGGHLLISVYRWFD